MVNLKEKLIVPFLALFFSTVSACSSANIPLGNTQINSQSVSEKEFDKAVKSLNLAPGEKPTVIDVGNGKPGGSFAFSIDFKPGFKTKNNASGFDGTFATIRSFKLALVSTSSALFGDITGDVLAGPFSVTKTGTSPTSLILKNVNTGSYYVAVAGYMKTVTGTAYVNLGAAMISGDRYAISGSGGDTNAGIITVNSSLQVNPAASSNKMGIALALANAVGASIDTSVTITNGVYTGSVIGPT